MVCIGKTEAIVKPEFVNCKVMTVLIHRLQAYLPHSPQDRGVEEVLGNAALITQKMAEK